MSFINMLKAILFSISLLPLLAHSSEELTVKAPNISEEDVIQIFGQSLFKGDRAANLLLLAIAIDSQSSTSPTSQEKIGIPYIVDAGPGYWVRLLQMNESTLDVLVNNALMLLYMRSSGEETKDQRKSAAYRLLEIAAQKGYWPAMAYVAEETLNTATPDTPEIKIKQSFDYLNQCASVSFAPCQFKLGIWYLNDDSKPGAWLPFLQTAVEVASKDERYKTSRETISDLEFALTILSDPKSQLPSEQREYYLKMLEANKSIFTER